MSETKADCWDRTPYREVAKACRREGIETLLELSRRTTAAAARYYPEEPATRFSDDRLSLMLQMRTSRYLFPAWLPERDTYSPAAVCVSVVLGRHARFLFGPQEKKTESYETKRLLADPQRDRINALLKEAPNPLTGKKGIRPRDLRLRGLSSAPETQKIDLCYLTPVRPILREASPSPFDPVTGRARLWAEDLATILDQPVERVFSKSAEAFARWQTRNGDHEKSLETVMSLYRLPMLEAEPLTSARAIIDDRADIEGTLIRKETNRRIYAALMALSREDRKLLIERFWDDKTLQACGKDRGVTRERIRQKQNRALGRIKKRLISIR